MTIKPVVESLCRECDTRDPFEIARQKNIIVLFEPLGFIRGYYNFCYRQKFIHINDSLLRPQMQFTAAHELGHAVLHPKSNTPFLREHTLFSVNKLETEANRFAVSLLYSDDDMSELQDCSLDQIACAMGVNRELAEYRVKNTLCFK